MVFGCSQFQIGDFQSQFVNPRFPVANFKSQISDLKSQIPDSPISDAPKLFITWIASVGQSSPSFVAFVCFCAQLFPCSLGPVISLRSNSPLATLGYTCTHETQICASIGSRHAAHSGGSHGFSRIRSVHRVQRHLSRLSRSSPGSFQTCRPRVPTRLPVCGGLSHEDPGPRPTG